MLALNRPPVDIALSPGVSITAQQGSIPRGYTSRANQRLFDLHCVSSRLACRRLAPPESRSARRCGAKPPRGPRPERCVSLSAPFWRSHPSVWQLALVVARPSHRLGNVRFSACNNTFYDAPCKPDQRVLAQRGSRGGRHHLVLAVVRLVEQQRLVMRWRGMTAHLLAHWLRPLPLSLGRCSEQGLENPDQRLSLCRSFVAAREPVLGLLNSSRRCCRS